MKTYNKKKLLTILILLFTAFSIVFVGCSSTTSVNFIVDDEIYESAATSGREIVSLPQSPTKDGYTFEGWYFDKDTWTMPFLEESFLEAPLLESVNVYAYFKKQQSSAPHASPPEDSTVTEPETPPEIVVQNYTVSFDTDDGSSLDNVTIEEGAMLSMPTTPKKEGHTLTGWYKDSAFITQWIFDTDIVTEDMTLYAKWEIIGSQGLIYTLSADFTYYSVTGYEGTDTEVVVPHSYDDIPVREIASGAFLDKTHVTNIYTTDSITSIGLGAFEGCSSLTRITLPFVGATLDGDSNTHFGYVFGAETYQNQYYASSSGSPVPETLTEVVIREGTVIEDNAFYYCAYLTKVSLPDSITDIGADAFIACRSLVDIDMPDSLMTIGDYAFRNCIVENVSFPEGLTTIGKLVFQYCKIKTIHIPSTVTSIGYGTFNTSASSITVADLNARYFAVDNCLIDSHTDTLVAGCKNSVIPANCGIRIIGKYAFHHCYNMQSIDIPYGVTQIESCAFLNAGIRTYNLPEGLLSIGDNVFSDNYITSIILPSSLQSIGDCAFYDCQYLESIIIPDNVTEIDSFWGVFYNCKKLVDVTLGDGLTKLESGLFRNCKSLVNITIPRNVVRIEADAFTGSGIASVTFEVTSGWYRKHQYISGSERMNNLSNPEYNAFYIMQIPEGQTLKYYWVRQ